jgi:SNF2 family DNA or RNA helicase
MQARVVPAESESSSPANYGSKLQRIAHLLRTIKQSGEKAIMFVEWSGLMRAIRAILTAAGLQVSVISGNCNTRASAIQKMQAGELDVLLMSLESSTSGLNLVAANHVIFPHAFVNVPPGAVEQAIARVHRLGQTKQVYVHTFIAEGPEQQIHEQQQQPQRA